MTNGQTIKPLASELLKAMPGMRRTPSGEVLAALVDRLHAACLTAAALPSDGPGSVFSTWPAYRHEWWDHGAHLTDSEVTASVMRHAPFTPSREQIDDCLPALTLMAGLSAVERQVVAERAKQEWFAWRGGWRAIAEACLLDSHTKARRLHWQVVLLAYARQEALEIAKCKVKAA